MLKLRLEEPTVKTEHPALVIGLPGLLGLDEDNRVKRMLAELNEEGYYTLLFDFANIHEGKGEKLLRSRPHLNAGGLTDKIERVRRRLDIPPNRTALIANSISAIPATRHLLLAHPEIPAVYASFSPLPGWPYFLTPEKREIFELGKADIPVSTPLDKESGVKRIIPKDFIPK